MIYLIKSYIKIFNKICNFVCSKILNSVKLLKAFWGGYDMKKKFVGALMAVALVAPTTLCFTGCGETDSISARDIYSFAAVSSAQYLFEMESDLVTSSTILTSNISRPESISEADEKNLTTYLGMFDEILQDDSISHTTSRVTSNDPERYHNYKNKMNITIPTITNQIREYILYFTETNTENNRDVQEHEVNISSTLTGKLVIIGDEYDVIGTREVEINEKGERETEIEFTTVSPSGNEVIVKQTIEEDEIEYEYHIEEHPNSDCEFVLKAMHVETSKENEERELYLEFESKNGSALRITKYEIVHVENTTDSFNVHKMEETSTQPIYTNFQVKVTNEDVTFYYENNFISVVNK